MYKGAEVEVEDVAEGEEVWANEQLPITTSFVNVSFEPFLSWRKYTMPFGTRAPLRKMGFILCEGANSLAVRELRIENRGIESRELSIEH